MANASVRGLRRVLALGIGLALLGSLVLHLDRSALAKDPPKSTTKPAKPGDPAKAAPVTFALDTKDQSVAEMVGLINTKVGEWKESQFNKTYIGQTRVYGLPPIDPISLPMRSSLVA